MLLTGPDASGRALVIGLVNNVSPAALRQTEEQFVRLLQDASTGMLVRLRCFSPRRIADAHYEGLDALWSSRLDGVIVTGAEPAADAIRDEPLWSVLSRLTDWAAANTRAALFSCLAAHAAVYRLSGLERRRLPAKLSGVYPVERASMHPWMSAAPASWLVPHSRHNDLDSARLEGAGYDILSRVRGLGDNMGVDSFVRAAGRSQFLMLQGHPEYSADSLLLEYRRDLRRFLRGQRPDWPAIPPDYFDADTEYALARLKHDAIGRAPDQVMADFAGQIETLPVASWQHPGTELLKAWLESLTKPMVGHGQMLALAAS